MRSVRNALLILVLLSACLKDKVTYPIFHQTFVPTESFTCVDTLIQHPSGCGMIVQPADSAVFRTIDLDNDGQADFQISCTSWYDFVSASYPCANYNTSYVISAIQNNGSVATTGNFNEVRKYSENDSISSSHQWYSSAGILVAVNQAPFVTDFNGSSYFGLKIRKNNQDWYGWLKLEKSGYHLTLLASGVKQGPSTGIKAGQIQ